MTSQTKRQNPIIVAIKDIIAGTVGGVGIVAVGHPFDTIKVRLQTQPFDKPLYSGMIDCAKKTIQWEGPGGLYKGYASPLIGQMVFNAVQFCVYGQALSLFKREDGFVTIPGYFGAGFLTGIGVSFVEAPMDLFKSQVQYQIFQMKQDPNFKPEFNGVISCCRTIVSKFGLRGFYQGLGVTLVRDVIGVSCYFGAYEYVRRSFLKPGQSHRDVEKLSPLKILFAGGVGGAAYWLPVVPIDVVKSSLQTDSIYPEKRIYKSTFDCIKKLYARGGYAMFLKGFWPCVLRSAPANAACFLCYKSTRDIIG